MSPKKLLLALAATALAVGVLVGPASASAAMFLHNNNGIGSTKVVNYAGPGEFANAAGGVACPTLDVTVAFDTDDAKITAFTGTNCKTTGLPAAFGCVVTGHPVAANIPWTVDPLNNKEATVTNLKINIPLKSDDPPNSDCVFADENGNIVISGNVTMTAKTAGSADAISLSGTVESPTFGEQEFFGSLTSAAPGTIQIID